MLAVLTYKSYGHMQRILLKTLVKTSMLKVFMKYRNLCLYFLRWMMLRDLFIAVMEIILEEIVRDRNTSKNEYILPHEKS